MKLSARVAELLTTVRDGLSLPIAADMLNQDIPHLRQAFASLIESRKAKKVRRGSGGAIFLYPINSNVRACVICSFELKTQGKKTKTCSYSCARHLAFQNPEMRARHKASTARAAKSPKRLAKMRKIAKEVGNRPEERERRSECSRRSWADPEMRARRTVAMKDAWTEDKAKARRGKARKKKLALWSDPEWKAKTVAAMRTGKRSRLKRAVIALAEQVPHLDETAIAREVGITLGQLKILMRRAHNAGELSRKPADGRRVRQSVETIAKRLAGKAAHRQMEASP